jgi:hypothetical protein
MAIRISDALRTAALVTGSWKSRLDGGFIYMFSGTQPTSAEDAANGTLLAVFSIDALGVTGLTFTTGDNAGEMKKTVAEAWEATGLADGTARWFRFNRLNTNETTTRAEALAAAGGTVERIDGSVGTSGSDLTAASVAIATSAPLTIDTLVVVQPASLS